MTIPRPANVTMTDVASGILRDLSVDGTLPLSAWDGLYPPTTMAQALNYLSRQGLLVIEKAHVHLDPSRIGGAA